MALFLSNPQDWYIIRAKPCISSKTAKPFLHLITPQGVYFPILLRIDDIQRFALMKVETDRKIWI